MEKVSKKLIKYFLFPTLIFVGVSYLAYQSRLEPGELKVSFYSVGQGDATFIQTYRGSQILIDGGPSKKILEYLGRDMPYFDNEIELVVLSHTHADHVSGLIEVLKRYRVKMVLLPEVEFDSEPFKRFLQLVEIQNIPKVYAHTSQRLFLDDSTVFDVYHPRPGKMIAQNDPSGSEVNPNDASILGKLSFGKTKFLFTGDAGFTIEAWALPKFNLDADVLKVGHQGSKYSTSREFLEEVAPVYSVILVGRNSYGHPSPETLNRLQEASVKILRTDQNGSAVFVSDGFSLNQK